MRAQRNALLAIAAVALTMAVFVGDACAQKTYSRGTPNIVNRGGGYHGSGGYNGGYRGPGFNGGLGAVVPGVIVALPPGGRFIDDGTVDDGPGGPGPRQRAARRGPTGVPPAGERRFVPDEVVIEIANSVSAAQIDALQRRFRLTRVESIQMQLSGTTLFRWRIPDRRSVATVVRALERDRIVASAQPNYLFRVQQDTVNPGAAARPEQYELAKLHLPQAHALVKGDNIVVAVIDSGIDVASPELAGSIAGSFDALSVPMAAHRHGTAIAGLIAAHGRLTGAAPAARILAVRAFNPEGDGAQGTTFDILKGIDWAVAHGARVINMSFAGPNDPGLHRSLVAAHSKGVVLVAAAGNAGPKSPPLYPAADAIVIAVTATDAGDKLFAQANRGRHIAIAAPGDQILVAIPDGSYEVGSGTSYAAAEISGIVALMLQRQPSLTPDKLRQILLATAKDLGPRGRDSLFGAGLADAYGAVMAETPPVAAASPAVERVSTGQH